MTAGWMAPLRSSRALRRIHRRMKARRAALEAGQENPALLGSTTESASSRLRTAQQQKIALQIPQNSETMVHITATGKISPGGLSDLEKRVTQR